MGIKPCKTTSWWLDASLPICYFTDFAASAKSWAELLLTVVTVQPSASCYGNHAPKCLPFSILCAKSVIIHTAIACVPIKTGMGVNYNYFSIPIREQAFFIGFFYMLKF